MLSYVIYGTLIQALLNLGADYVAAMPAGATGMDIYPSMPSPFVVSQLKRFLPVHAANRGEIQTPAIHYSLDLRHLVAFSQFIVPAGGGVIAVAFEKWMGRALAHEIERIVARHEVSRLVGFPGRSFNSLSG